MKENSEKICEIMAPAGSFDSLSAAIKAGANAVYFGVGNLNMRSHSANNFSQNDLPKISELCKKFNIKTYLAINTVLNDSDIKDMQEVIGLAKNAGISAIIASDPAAMIYAHNIGMEVHLSVQLNITNTETLKFYSQFADVAVLARELNLEQIKHIHDRITKEQIKGPSGKPVRIEMFCHGALCMAISGKCYLSLHHHNTSANKGQCYQLCRRAYTVKDRDSDIELDVENEYIMSPKDLKTIHFLDKILSSGVSILKIEGRARGPEYVKTTVECYREAVNACLNNKFTEEKVIDWDKRLEKVFNRGFWNGYYLGQRLGEWNNNYGNSATEKKLYLGKIIKYFPKIKVSEMLLETNSLSEGDKVLITGPTTGAINCLAEDIRVEDIPVKTAHKGQQVSFRVPEKTRPSDKLFKILPQNHER